MIKKKENEKHEKISLTSPYAPNRTVFGNARYGRKNH